MEERAEFRSPAKNGQGRARGTGPRSFGVCPLPLLLDVCLFPAASPGIVHRPPRLLPTSVTTQWYEVVLRTTRMPRYFLNSLMISSASMLGSIVVATWGRTALPASFTPASA